MKVFSDEDFTNLKKNKKVQKVTPSPPGKPKDSHPFIKHMKKIEDLISQINIPDNGSDEIIKLVANILDSYRQDNVELMDNIVTLQKELKFALNRHDGDEEWRATVTARDNNRLIKSVKFERIK